MDRESPADRIEQELTGQVLYIPDMRPLFAG